MRRVLVLVVLLLLAGPAVGLAQVTQLPSNPGQNPFTPIPPAQQEEPEREDPTDGGGDLSPLQTVLIFGGAVALVGGITFAIFSDARRSAPSAERRAASTGFGAGLSDPDDATNPRKQRDKSKRRAKGKAARAARKKSRR